MIIRYSTVASSVIATLLLPSVVSAASFQSFCKCICGGNSTIIPLDGKPLDAPARVALSLTPSLPSSTAAVPEADLLLPPDALGGASAFSGSNIASGDGSAIDSIYDPADHGFDIADSDSDANVRDVAFHLERHLAKRQDRFDELFGTSTSSDMTSTTTSSMGMPSESAEVEDEDESTAGNSTETQLVTPKVAGTCNDCNRQFCLDHPDFDRMCGEAKEEEVFTTCFQRDSTKDQIVVYTFICVTVGLLAYAAVRPWMQKKYAAVRERRSYATVPSG